MAKTFSLISRTCALLGGLLGLGISMTVLISTIIERNWGAIPFLLVPLIANLLVLVLSIWFFNQPYLSYSYSGITMLLIFFLYLSRFSIGIFLLPSTVFLLFATIFKFLVRETPMRGRQLDLPGSNFSSVDHQPQDQMLTSTLTSRERDVLKSLMLGLSNQEIAQSLYISENTVRRHVHEILKKLNCSSRTQAAVIGRKEFT